MHILMLFNSKFYESQTLNRIEWKSASIDDLNKSVKKHLSRKNQME